MHALKHTRNHETTTRAALVVLGLVSLIAAAGFTLRLASFVALWPLGDSVAVDCFLGAYLAGIGASLLWVGVSGELGAAVAGAISLAVVYTSLAIAWLTLTPGAVEPRLRPIALVWVVEAVTSIGLALWFRRFCVRGAQPLPRPVYLSFVLFALLLAFVGGSLLLRKPNIFPLPLGPAAAALIGSAFLGSTAYFLYSLRFPLWRHACAPLWGFLAYDLVLIAPLVSRLGSVDAAHRPALMINVAVLVVSGVLAVYYLLIARRTRIWSFARSRGRLTDERGAHDTPTLDGTDRREGGRAHHRQAPTLSGAWHADSRLGARRDG
jgi:hypothetical protein